MYGEQQYLKLIHKTLTNGEYRAGRNGKILSIFGEQLKFDLRENKIPLLTTKKIAWKTCLKELLWFLSGDTSNETLRKNNVIIWNGNSTRKFLNSRKLNHYPENELGPIYGFQWRNFNGMYNVTNGKIQKENSGVDQIDTIIQYLKNRTIETQDENYLSRRLVVSAWNPCQLYQMALPPCHVLFQFHVNNNDELSCSLYQRSGDIGLGIPFNIASYSFLTHLIAHHVNLKPGFFIHNLGDCHIYEQHIPSLKKQLKRTVQKEPIIKINEKFDNINDYKVGNFEIIKYMCSDPIKMDMIS